MSAGSNRDGSTGATRAADLRLDAAITDFFLPEDARLDDRTRLLLSRVLGAVVRAIEADIRRHAARLLAARHAPDEAQALLDAEGDVLGRLMRAGLLRDRELMDELIARVRGDLIAEALPVLVERPDRPSLLVRLSESGDSVVAGAANAMLIAEARRAFANEHGTAPGSDLPAELHHRLVWWVAATIREGMNAGPDTDRALAEAARRSLAAHDEGERVEAVAARLAAAIDALPQEVPALLVESLGDRRLPLFIALLARALSTDVEVVRAMVVDMDGDHLWPALRMVGLGREGIARIALALADADPRHDIEAFADSLDEIEAIDPAAARDLLAPLALPVEFRAAVRALARTEAS